MSFPRGRKEQSNAQSARISTARKFVKVERLVAQEKNIVERFLKSGEFCLAIWTSGVSLAR